MWKYRYFLARAQAATAQLCSDQAAVAAVEFAMILPVVVPLMMGLVEITSGLAVNRKVGLVAQTLSDLTSQSTAVATTDINGYIITGNAILTPYSSTPLKSTITQLYVQSATKVTVSWSTDLSAHPVNSIVTLPDALKITGTYLILAEVSYQYVPAVAYFLKPSGLTLSSLAYTRPRQSSCVRYNGATC